MREELKRQVETCIDRCSGELTELADTIWNNPEYNFKEYKACRSITGLLEKHGFEVERGTGGIETAFHAFCDSGKPGGKAGKNHAFPRNAGGDGAPHPAGGMSD